MDLKTLFGLTVLPAALLVSMLLACLSKRLRDLYFFLLIVLAPYVERLDVNFVSREWYRGTARGFEFSLLDILMAGLLAGMVLAPRKGQARLYWPPGFGWMLLFFFYAIFDISMTEPRLFSLFELWKMLRGLILFLAAALYLRSQREFRVLLWALGLMLCYQGLLALEERYWEGVHRVPGTFIHSNSLSVLLCLATPILVTGLTSRLPLLLKLLLVSALPLVCVAEVLTISRAGVIILPTCLLGAALLTMSYHLTARKVALCLAVALLGTGIAVKAWHSLITRFDESSLKEEYGNNRKLGRGYYLKLARIIALEQPFGVGLNNWSYWVSDRYGPRLGYNFVPYRGTDQEPSQIIPSEANIDEAQAAPAHNLGALTVGELGIPGLALFSLMWVRWFQMASSFVWPRSCNPLRRLPVGILFCLFGVSLHSWTEWAFRQYAVYYLFHILMGALASLYYLKHHPWHSPFQRHVRSKAAVA